MNGRPYFRMYAQDWLTSESIQLFSAEQEGAYIRLLAIMWTNKHCALKPEEMRALSRFQSSDESFSRVLANFVPHPRLKGHVTNPRLYEEFQSYQQYVKRQSECGKKGVQVRREKAKGTLEGSPRQAQGLPEGSRSQTQTQTHSSLHLQKDEKKSLRKASKALVDEKFLEELEQAPKFKLFRALNIRAEALTAEQWCKDNRRNFTPAMFLNWLKKALVKLQQLHLQAGARSPLLGLRCPSRVKTNPTDRHFTSCGAQPYQPPQEWPQAPQAFCELHYRQWLKVWHPKFLSPELPIKTTKQEKGEHDKPNSAQAAS